MLMRILSPILNFISSLGKQDENEKMNAILRPYVGKKLWLAMTPDRSRVLFSEPTLGKLRRRAKNKGLKDFISLKAPRKLRPS